jgi:hypothetical protein
MHIKGGPQVKKIAAAVIALGLFMGVSLGSQHLQFQAGAGEGAGAVGGIPVLHLNAGAGEGGGCV